MEKTTAAVVRLREVIRINNEIADSCKVIVELLQAHPELDYHLCKAFGIQLPPPTVPLGPKLIK